MWRLFRRALGRVCWECDGSGYEPVRFVNVDRLPCSACVGTGLRLVQRSEIAIERHGQIKERRRKR